MPSFFVAASPLSICPFYIRTLIDFPLRPLAARPGHATCFLMMLFSSLLVFFFPTTKRSCCCDTSSPANGGRARRRAAALSSPRPTTIARRTNRCAKTRFHRLAACPGRERRVAPSRCRAATKQHTTYTQTRPACPSPTKSRHSPSPPSIMWQLSPSQGPFPFPHPPALMHDHYSPGAAARYLHPPLRTTPAMICLSRPQDSSPPPDYASIA